MLALQVDFLRRYLQPAVDVRKAQIARRIAVGFVPGGFASLLGSRQIGGERG